MSAVQRVHGLRPWLHAYAAARLKRTQYQTLAGPCLSEGSGIQLSMAVKQISKSQLQVGDYVEWAPSVGEELPSAGTIVAIRRESVTAEEDSEYVVQVTPKIIGIYHGAELNFIRSEPAAFGYGAVLPNSSQ
jgi:hypothetical protein